MIASIKNLRVSFKTESGANQVIHNVSFDIHENEILAIVGESGSGKSVTSRVLMGLLPADKTIIKAEKVDLLGNNLLSIGKTQWEKLRGNRVSMIFQEPMSSSKSYHDLRRAGQGGN